MPELSADYLNGEIVRIIIDEAEVIELLDAADDPHLRLQIIDNDGDQVHVTLPLTGPVKVYRVTPAGGMPKPGDLWRDRFGTEYFAKREGPAGSEARLVHAGYTATLWESVDTVNRERGPLTLVYRPEVSDASS